MQDFFHPATRYYSCLHLTLFLPYDAFSDCQSSLLMLILLWYHYSLYIPQSRVILFKSVFPLDCNLTEERSTLFNLYTCSVLNFNWINVKQINKNNVLKLHSVFAFVVSWIHSFFYSDSVLTILIKHHYLDPINLE